MEANELFVLLTNAAELVKTASQAGTTCVSNTVPSPSFQSLEVFELCAISSFYQHANVPACFQFHFKVSPKPLLLKI